MNEKNCFLIIDPQNDFCDIKGSLYVKNADKDMINISQYINKNVMNIDSIFVTLDSHHLFDISHPNMWMNNDFENPAYFTVIKSDDIKNKKWFPYKKELTEKFITYCEKLEHRGKFPLTIWPPHCLIGSTGAAVYPILFDSLTRWEKINKNSVVYIRKGENPHTEHYSAIEAEVPLREDASTYINHNLIESLKEFDNIYVCGEAGNCCVESTLNSIIGEFGNKSLVSKIILLLDCTSPLPGSEDKFKYSISKFVSAGIRIEHHLK